MSAETCQQKDQAVNSMSKNPLLQLREVSRSDNSTGKQLLSSVSLDICLGDRIGLVGASGSGKSTLMRAIVMLDHCSGDLFYRGKPISNDAIPSYRREVIYLSQRPFFTDGTVEENLRLPFQFKSSDGNRTGHTFQLDLAADALNAFELSTQILKQPCESLSGGEQQMVALTRALLMEPQVLLLDEPTAALDADAREKFENRIRVWHSESTSGHSDGKAFLWTSHDPTQVNRMTQRTITMHRGELDLPTESASHRQEVRKIKGYENDQQMESSDD
ncbi:ATP-binding cassette domain-containing protein [Rubripirellula sp.]|nr:ATP-binding cassette domain-containing protein [Rubripirellula sp.]MDB4749816.1 ATP-binding cassette domain-containing protein [Rubripirellula sp.]